MTFLEAFKAALNGAHVRREGWHSDAALQASPAHNLECAPPYGRHWQGAYNVIVEDVEATDWVVCE